MPAELSYRALPFEEAILFVRRKLLLPSEVWLNLLRAEHDWAFMVAGATKAELLQSLFDAVDQAISSGTTLEEFRRDFDRIIQDMGWSYKGTRGRRTETIYRTNLRTAHAAGRYRQMTSEGVRQERPFWQYRHGSAVVPRELHVRSASAGGWNGLVLPGDDPWWQEHYPPNGWGCSCFVVTLSQADLDRLGLSVGRAPDNETYEWVNPLTGEAEDIPVGVEPEWNYAPGASAEADRGRIFDGMLSRMRPELRGAVQAEIARQTQQR